MQEVWIYRRKSSLLLETFEVDRFNLMKNDKFYEWYSEFQEILLKDFKILYTKVS